MEFNNARFGSDDLFTFSGDDYNNDLPLSDFSKNLVEGAQRIVGNVVGICYEHFFKASKSKYCFSFPVMT